MYRASMIGAGDIETDVALKLLRTDSGDASDPLARLRDEARTLAALRHPAILRVLDVVWLADHWALVTEYIPGEDLSHCLDDMPLSAVLEVLAQVADGLVAAWVTPSDVDGVALGLLHRDIKPSNIRISRHGQTKILDFGIAMAAVSSPTETPTSPVGSAPYMAPERFEGRGLTPASDVFSLGCILYQALSGSQLNAAKTPTQLYLQALSPEVHRAHTTACIGDLGTSGPVTELLAEMLAYDAGDRPEITTLPERLRHLEPGGVSLRAWARAHPWTEDSGSDGPLDGRVLSARTARQPASGPPPSRARTPVLWLALTLVIAALGVGWWMSRPVAQPSPPPVPPPPEPVSAAPVTRSPPSAPEPPDLPEPDRLPRGTVNFVGDHTTVVLIDADDRRHPPGAVPVGTYTIIASFPEAANQRAGQITVSQGTNRTLHCIGRFYSCK